MTNHEKEILKLIQCMEDEELQRAFAKQWLSIKRLPTAIILPRETKEK